MKLYIIIATLVACACSAPTVELLYPTPVNPDLFVGVKPEEKIVLITDPSEISKFKRAIKLPFYPTVLPNEREHHKAKRDIPLLLASKHQHVENSANDKETYKNNKLSNETVTDQVQNHFTAEGFHKPQTLPLLLKHPNSSTQQCKRDIPVPLVPKRHHPEESPKDTDKKDSFEKTEEFHKANHYKPQMAEREKYEIPSQISQENRNITQQQKRESSTSLLSKSEFNEDNKAMNLKNYHVSEINNLPHSLSSETFQHITAERFNKPQSNHNDSLNQNDNLHNNFHSANHQTHYKEKITPIEIQKSQLLTTHQEVQHPKQSHNEFNINKNNEKQNIDEHSSIHEFTDRLSESISSKKLTQNTQNSNIQEDHLRVHDVMASTTTEYSLIRQRPVPVAELFAKSHGN